MSYFDFDLQLFADPVTVEVPITSELKQATAGTYTLYKKTDDSSYVWSTEELTEGYTAVGAVVEVSGTGTALTRTLTVTKAGLTDVVLSGVTKEDLASLAGVTVKTMADADNAIKCKIAIDGIDGSITAETLTFTSAGYVAADADAGITVSAAGVVSGLANGASFSVYTSMSDTQPTTYTAGATTLAVTGDKVGTYTVTTIGDVKVALADGKVTEGENEVTTITVPGTFTPEEQTTAVDKYYAVTVVDGAYEVATEAANAAVEGAVGYFKVTTADNYGEPTATITFVSTYGGSTSVTLLGDVSINAAALTKVGSTDINQVIVNADTTGKVSVTNVTNTADVVINGSDPYTKDATSDTAAVSYTKTYTVGAAKTISLKGLTDTNTEDGAVATTYYFEIKTTDSQDHGKQVYSIGTDKVTTKDAKKSYFTVAVTTNNSATQYEVGFVTGTGNAPENLKEVDWSGIQINADGIASTDGNTAEIVVTGDGTTDAQDTYVVNNAAIGVVVEPKAGKLTAENINRADGTVATTLTITAGNEITLTKTAGTAYYKIVKSDPANDGNQTLTVTKETETPSDDDLAAGNYIKVTTAVADDKTTCTVSYTGSVSLSGLTNGTNAVKIPLVVADGFDNSVEVDITGSNVDYAITDLPAGTVVKGIDEGKDIVTFKEGLKNGVKLALVELTEGLADGESVSYAVTAGAKDEATGYKTVTLGDKLTTPTETDNYFTIKKEGKTYTVTYTKATPGEGAIDLSTATGGATNIDTTGITDKDTVIQLVKTGVNGYTATNVVSGGFNAGKGIQVGTVNETTFTKTEDLANITYLPSNSFVQTAENKIDLGNTDKVYTVVATGPEKGVTTYTLAQVENVAAAESAKASYFKVTKSEDGKTVTLSYVENAEGVSRETLVKVAGEQINVKAPTGDTVTTIVLTDDTTNAINYNVTGITAGVTVQNADEDKDTLTYVTKSTLSTEANELTLGTKTSTVYYEVTAGDAVKGIYTCSIGSTALTEKPADSKNYFTVTTADGTVNITYHKATEGSVAYDLANNTVVVDATQAAEQLTITAGASGDDSYNITYKASDLTKGQTIAAGDSSNATVTPEYVTTYEVKYTAGDGITTNGLSLLNTSSDSSLIGKTYYYTVTKSDEPVKGEYTYTVAKADSKPATGAYFAVSYGSAYVTTVSYVNVSGSADLNLANIGKQIAIDASSSVATTIDITDTEGNRVNYALTNVGSNVTVEGAGKGDTVAKVGGEVTLDDSITLTEAAKAYYVVDGEGKLTATDEPTTADNYITVTKTGENYDISYTQSATSTAYTLANDGVLTVDAKDAAKGAISKTGVTAKVNVTNAKHGTTGSVDGISFKTGFAWAAGTYYLPIEDASSNVTLDSTATAGSTTVGNNYVIITVAENDGVYTVTKTGKVAVAAAKVVTDGGDDYSGKVTLAAPATAVKLDGTSLAADYITGVAKDSVLTNIANTVEVTTAKLNEGESVSINADGEGNAIKYTAGAASAITVVGGKITTGVLALSEANATLTGSAESTKSVTLVESSNGVVVTYADGKVASITGVDAAEEKVSYDGATYIFSGEGLVRKYSNGTSEWAYVSANGDVVHADYYPGTAKAPTALQVGGFQWAEGTYYVKATETVKATEGTTTTLAGSTDKYLKITLSDENTISKITVLKNNTQGLPTTIADATDTVNIEAGSAALTYDKTTNGDMVTVNITNAANGSTFVLGDNDTVTTAELANNDAVTVNSVVYTATGMEDDAKQQLSFTGKALKSGTVAVAASTTYTLADGSTLETKASTAAVVTVADGKIKSITGLGVKDEEIVITNGDTETTFKVGENTKEITKTVKDNSTGESSTSTITLAEVDADVWNATAGNATYNFKNTIAFDAKTPGYGYFKATFNSEKAVYGASVATSSVTDVMKNGELYFKAELTRATKADGSTFAYNTLTLTAGTIVNGVFTEDTTGVLNGAVVTIEAGASAQELHFANEDNINVVLKNVPAASELTLKKGDTVTTAELDADATITINDTVYTAKAGTAAALTFYAKAADDVRLVGAGTVLVTDTLSGMKDTATEGTTVAYEPKAGVAANADGNDGVVVTYGADGAVTAIKDLEAGETVTTTSGTVTKTYTANSKEADIVTVTVTGYTGEDADEKNGTFVKDIGNAGDDIVGSNDGNAAVSKDYTFNWAGAKAATETEAAVDATGYFLVDAEGKVTVDGTKVTIDNTIYDKDQKVIKATLQADGTLTLTKATIGITGAVTDTSNDIEAKAVTLAISGSQKVNYTAASGIALTVTGAGAGSVFGGSNLDADDSITTAALDKDATITVGTHVYKAGAASDTLVISGDNKVSGGTFALETEASSNSAHTLTAYTAVEDVTDLKADDVVTTRTVVTYTAGTGDDAYKNGATVKVEDGIVTSVTGMGAGETVKVVESTTTKGNGTPSKVTTTYTSKVSGSVYEITKTIVDAEGKTTEYTQTFSNDSQNVIKDTGWKVKNQTTETLFDFAASEKGSVGYFKAEAVSGNANQYVLASDSDYNTTADAISAQKQKESKSQTITTLDEGSYYIKVEAERSVAGAVTINGISLVQVQSNGELKAVTGKTIGDLKLSLTDGTTLALPEADRSYGIAITTAGNATITNVKAADTISGTVASGKTVNVNGTAYVSGAATFTLNGDGTVKDGTFTVKDAALTAATSGDAVSYTKGTTNTDGAEVVFVNGKITTISKLDTGESVKVTAADGTETTYTATSETAITRTVKKGGVTETMTATITDNADVVGATYGLTSKFDWAVTEAGSIGYFAVDENNEATVAAQPNGANVTPTASTVYARVQVSGTAADGYTISSVQLLKGTTLADVTAESTTTTVAITIAAPGSLNLTDTTAGRKYTLNITGAESGQSFEGLSAADTVATAELKSATVTVNKVTYTNAVPSTMTINGDGTAKAGQFALASGKSAQPIKVKTSGGATIEVTATTGDGATVSVANNALVGITKMDKGDTVVVTTTSAAGVATKVTYEAKTADDSEGITITKTTLADGATTVETYTATSNGENIYTAEYTAADKGNSITGKLDWTAKAGSTGYFEAKSADGTALGTVDVTAGTTAKITENNAGKVYLKVSTTYAAAVEATDTTPAIPAKTTVTAVEAYQVSETGTLSKVTLTSGTVNIPAPTGLALVLDASSSAFDAKAALNITGAAADSDITLRSGDSLTTAVLSAGKAVTVSGQVFTAAANGALKFTAKGATQPVLADGTILAAAGSFTAAGISTADDDDVTVNVTGSDAVVTVTNGVVTAISGQTSGNTVQTVTANGADITYTYDGTRYNVTAVSGTTSGEVAFAALANGATIATIGGGYTSGADNNTIVLVNGQLKNGTVKAANNVTVTAIGATSSADDDIEVKYTGSGNAVITVANGQVTSIKGLTAENDTVVVTAKKAGEQADGTVADVVTTYKLTASGTVEKTVKVGTDDASAAQTAYITSGGDLLAANYIGGTAESALVGQFNWNTTDINGRNLGYFAITENSNGVKKASPIDSQPTEINATAKGTAAKPVTKKYLVANLNGSELSIGALSVTNNGTTTTTDVLDVTSAEDFSAADTVTINAPTTAITYDKGKALFTVTINKLAADSIISNIDAGDKVTTATLTEGSSVTVDDISYTAGAKVPLTFVGEGDATEAPSTAKAALLTGTIKLNSTSGEALLSGALAAKDTGAADDIHVSTTSNTDVVVKVANGVITSITGLKTKGKTVLTWTGTAQEGSTATLYTVLDDAGTMIKKQEWTDTDGEGDADESGVTTSYLNLTKAGAEIYKATYKAAADPIVSDFSFSDVSATTKTYGYVAVNVNDNTETKTIKSVDVDKTDANKLITTATNAVPGSYYLKVTATTAKNGGATTINNVELQQAGATGALTTVKSSAGVAYTCTLNIDGMKTAAVADPATPATYAVLNYALPAASKRSWKLNVTNAALGSTFTNLTDGDLVTTANTADYELKGKTVTVYNVDTGKQETTQVTAKGGDGVKLTVVNGAVTSVTDFEGGETLTVVSKDPSDGMATYEYKAVADRKTGDVTITRTITDNEGNKNVSKATIAAADVATLQLLPAGDAAYGEASTPTPVTWETSGRTVYSDFNWTMDKAKVGYFVVNNSSAKVVSGKPVTINSSAKNYIAVEISADGVVDSVKQMKFDTTTAANMAETGTFVGTLNITAPTAVALNFDRSVLDTSSVDAENTKVVITGAIAGSDIKGLANGDTVKTAKLAPNTGKVTIGGYSYTAGAASQLGFAHTADTDVVTSGTLKLTDAGSNTQGTDLIYIYNGTEVLPIKVTKGDGITVTATTNRNTTTYTIGDLGENESFTVGEVTYLKSGNTLFREDENGKTAVFSKTVSSSVSSTLLNTTNNWKDVKTTFSDGEDGTEQVTTLGTVTADLSLADKRVAADKKAAEKAGNVYAFPITGYDYVLDKYVSTTTNKKALNAAVVENTAAWQVEIGVVTALNNGTDYTYQYDATNAIAQAIKVAKNWAAVGSGYDDTITGATSGKDFIRGGAGDDTITLGGAEDTVVFNLTTDGHNIVSKYISGKDQIILDGGDTTATTAGTYSNDFSVYLDTKANNVYLYADNGDGKYDETTDGGSVMLQAMGTGKAVTINGKDYYFGNGKLSGNRTTTTAGTTFTYAEGAYYYGNDSGKNALKVATDKTKYSAKTLGDDVVIDLTKVDDDGRALYNNIQTVDASASANRLVLTAAASGSTLKGGSYQSTLKSGAGNDTLQGGSGQDVFWFDDLGGNDTVKSYTSGKDSIYMGGNEDLSNYKVTASGTNVVITKEGDSTSSLTIAGAVNAAKAITVSKDGKVGGESVSYFVGKSGAKVSNSFTYVDGAYYVGNSDTKDASAKVLDTLKVTGTLKTEPTAKTEINLNDTNKYQSIEAVDASTRKVASKVGSTNAGVVVTANSTNGTLFKASSYSDTFICNKSDTGKNVLQNFSVGDIIQINGLDEDQTKAVAAQINSLTKGAGNVIVGDMTLTFKGTKGTATVVTDTTDPTVHKIVMK